VTLIYTAGPNTLNGSLSTNAHHSTENAMTAVLNVSAAKYKSMRISYDGN